MITDINSEDRLEQAVEEADSGGRKVALKVLRPELLASHGHERLRGITTTANLHHPPMAKSAERRSARTAHGLRG
ncbi:MAG: hypothetical protein HY337_02580 [Gemmatimonadetes bacterium]|nr:hypothetical protein [Gemmatimonadota bacterium]